MINRNGKLLSTREAATRLNISVQSLCRWGLPRVRIGKCVYYEEELIERILLEGYHGK